MAKILRRGVQRGHFEGRGASAVEDVLLTSQRKQIGARSTDARADDEREGGNLRRGVVVKEFEGLQENAQIVVVIGERDAGGGLVKGGKGGYRVKMDVVRRGERVEGLKLRSPAQLGLGGRSRLPPFHNNTLPRWLRRTAIDKHGKLIQEHHATA
jgi:hypothetical protein